MADPADENAPLSPAEQEAARRLDATVQRIEDARREQAPADEPPN